MTAESLRKADLLREHLRGEGTELCLFDLDDTLIYTERIFRSQMERFAAHVAMHTKSDYRDTWGLLVRFNDEAFSEYKVTKSRWHEVVRRFVDKFPDQKAVIKNGLEILLDIYNVAPGFREGAEETLGAFIATGVELGLVTHADYQWTRLKYALLEMDRFIPWKNVHVVNPYEFKTSSDWLDAISKHGFLPEQTMVVGDNVLGDIIAAREAGVEKTVYVEGTTWKLYLEGEFPSGTIVVKGGIGYLLDTLITPAPVV